MDHSSTDVLSIRSVRNFTGIDFSKIVLNFFFLWKFSNFIVTNGACSEYTWAGDILFLSRGRRVLFKQFGATE